MTAGPSPHLYLRALRLTRRCQRIFDLRRTEHVPPGGLDSIHAKDAKFSPNKFKSEVERLYMGMVRVLVRLGMFPLPDG